MSVTPVRSYRRFNVSIAAECIAFTDWSQNQHPQWSGKPLTRTDGWQHLSCAIASMVWKTETPTGRSPSLLRRRSCRLA